MHFFSSRPFPSCTLVPETVAIMHLWVRETISIMHLWVGETISICTLVPETVAIMHLWVRETISIMHLLVRETISICTLVPETVAIMHFSSRRGRETSSSNHHAFFPQDGVVRSGALKAMIFNFIISRLQWQVYFISI